MEIILNDKKRVSAKINDFIIKTDQSIKAGGDGFFPEPFTLFLASLGTCAGIYIKNFCDTRNLPAENIKLYQEVEYNREKQIIDKISLTISVPRDFPEKYHGALIQSAGTCAVKRHLRPDIAFDIKVLANQDS